MEMLNRVRQDVGNPLVQLSTLTRTMAGTLLPTGEIEFQGQQYSSPSDAGVAAKATIAGKKMSTNGWNFWQIQGGNERRRTLGEIRDACLKR